MQIVINGDQKEIQDGSTVADLLELLQIGRERVAVEVNMDIVPKAVYDTYVLTNGNQVEIVHFVGGG
ncbi:sulfur carrier protein ThiS [Pelotalea chapellei]|uniref:Sulfur carrier protein ThiS n=1 Tax=Pelotalea chapellei TaxID=44671 RepID=A0ABS5UC48_9BACT|nr:sulfur carrier protein ThiS [Pelotalea chapellei]MBT1073275.1 sulfur carrier protein ThiS [Pelotalea chapellei]